MTKNQMKKGSKRPNKFLFMSRQCFQIKWLNRPQVKIGMNSAQNQNKELTKSFLNKINKSEFYKNVSIFFKNLKFYVFFQN